MTDLYQELQEENDHLRNELDLWKQWFHQSEKKVTVLKAELEGLKHRLARSEHIMGPWLSACLEDPESSAELKKDVEAWFNLVTPSQKPEES